MKVVRCAQALLLMSFAAIAGTTKINVASEQTSPVGSKVTFVAETEAGEGWFRFRVRPPGGELEIVRDFGPDAVFFWSALKEGLYEIEATGRDLATGQESAASMTYEMTSRVAAGGHPAVSALDHPLVFLYSAPPCPAGVIMDVEFRSAEGKVTAVPGQTCDGVTSMNVYLAGLRANATYTVRHRLTSDSGILTGDDISFETPDAGMRFARNTVPQPSIGRDTYGVVLQSALSQSASATDLDGNLIWYYDGDVASITRVESGGRIMGFRQDLLAGPEQQVFRLFDLAGFTLKETNAARVSEQLTARGLEPITGFHHEVRLMPGGKFLVLASNERVLNGVQGEGDVDIIGDVVLVLNSDLEVEWVWNAFDHMDVHRKATLGETCQPQGGGCPPFFQALVANDWLHANSLQLTPDGNILISFRHQDWLVKIAYENGHGSGAVLWRLGKDGDFQAISDDPEPWFSHQHDGGFFDSEGSLTVFDNSNLRAETNPEAHSRGQVWKIDEAARTARLILNADLGRYSFALGSAQKLDGANYHFNLGWLPGTTPASARSVEVDESGSAQFTYDTAVPLYRTFRLKDLYTPPSY